MNTKKGLSSKVAARVRAVMGAQKITITTLANVLGQSQDMASRRVNGDVDFKLGEIEAIANLTGYNPADFLANEFKVKEMVPRSQKLAA